MTSQRLDAHHHFWTRARIDRGDYPWMPERGPLRDDYPPARLEPELRAVGVGGTIVVQAAASVDESRFLLDCADANEFVLGVTGWAPLDRSDAIETLSELARNEHLRAVRPMLHDISDPEWIARPQVRQNLHALVDLGLRFEILSRAEHLAPIADVIEAIPELPAVVNHVSKPVFRWDEDVRWRSGMARLAERPNTYCKLSGMVTEVGPGWTRADFEPYASFVFETFGAERVMFGSDWPVCRLVAEYGDVAELADQLIASLLGSGAGADAVWGRTAERFYGVHVADAPASA
jgi:L-fucono-1,5-lactonase